MPGAGIWRELLNSDAAIYGGSDQGNLGVIRSEAFPSHGLHDSLALTLPPLSTLILRQDRP